MQLIIQLLIDSINSKGADLISTCGRTINSAKASTLSCLTKRSQLPHYLVWQEIIMVSSDYTANTCKSSVIKNSDSPLIFHIPHSSTIMPEELTHHFCCHSDELKYEANIMGDLFTDELFAPLSAIGASITTQFSRVACDVERFDDDNNEPMSRHGMGAIYTHSITKNRIRFKNHNRQEALDLLYKPHHKQFNKLVNQAIKKHGQATIIDCHSFPSTKRWYQPSVENNQPLPDICIGTDEFHTPQYLRDFIISFFQEKNYTVKENLPFSGSITPLEHYGKTQQVLSIMIEINRKLYMDEIQFCKHSGFMTLLRTMNDLAEGLLDLQSVQSKQTI